MLGTSRATLKILAAVVWYSGAIVLSIKSTTLLFQAYKLNPDLHWTWLAAFCGILIGAIKARYLYNRLCYKNLQRIAALQQPKIWNFYRIHFFVFLALMVSLGSYLSRLAHGNYSMLVIMAIIEMSVGIALLGSAHCFWRAENAVQSATK